MGVGILDKPKRAKIAELAVEDKASVVVWVQRCCCYLKVMSLVEARKETL